MRIKISTDMVQNVEANNLALSKFVYSLKRVVIAMSGYRSQFGE